MEFVLDNLVFDFATLNPTPFSYEADPTLRPLNPEDPTTPFRHKPGSVLSVEVPLPLGRGETQDPSLRWTVLLTAEQGPVDGPGSSPFGRGLTVGCLA